MKKIWYSLTLFYLLLAAINTSGVNIQNISIIIILLHSLFVLVVFMGIKDKSIKITLALGFVARLILMFIDVYGRHIMIVPHAGADDDGFYRVASLISNNISLLSDQVYGGVYSKIVGTILYITGDSRLIGTYLNVILGITSILLIYKLLLIFKINRTTIQFIILLSTFFPTSIIMSSILRREAIITFFVTLSLYSFSKWFLNERKIYLIGSFLFLMLGSIFHSGIIGLGMGYLFAVIFYRHKQNVFKFSNKSIFYFLLFLIIFIFIYIEFSDVLFIKFEDLENTEDLYTVISHSRGDAAYLTNLSINNPVDFIIYLPIKMLYFFASPVPWDWRGIGDIITFSMDSIVYLSITAYVFKNYRKTKKNKTLIYCLLISLLGVGIIFGVGIGNAGTAMRHRQKLIPFFIILLALTRDSVYTNFCREDSTEIVKDIIV